TPADDGKYRPHESVLSSKSSFYDPKNQHADKSKKNQRQDRRSIQQSVCSWNIFGFDLSYRIAYGGFFIKLSKIPGVSRQLDPKRTGHHRLRLGGIGAGVVETVSSKNAESIWTVKSRQKRCRRHNQSGQTGRDKVDDVVQTGRTGSEITVSVVFVSHHGIHGIDAFIGKSQYRTADHQIKQRGDHTVGSVFRHRLHRGFGDARFAQI